MADRAPFLQIPTSLFSDADLTDGDVRVYCIVLSFADFGTLANCRPGLAAIASRAGKGLSTIKRSLATLESSGWLARERRTVQGKECDTTLYSFPRHSQGLAHLWADVGAPLGQRRPICGPGVGPFVGQGVGPFVGHNLEPCTKSHDLEEQGPPPAPSVPAQLTLEQPTPTPAPKEKANPILSLFLQACPSIPPRQFRAGGKKAAAAAARAWKAEPDAELWRKRFERAEASDFLAGRRLNDRGWRCDFLWLMARIEELESGRYDNREVAPIGNGRPSPTTTANTTHYRED